MTPEGTEKLRTEADYFERHAEGMRYPKFRRQHLFVGWGYGGRVSNGDWFTPQKVGNVLDGQGS